jgi:predicted TPR repeat methyltransferase
MENFNLYSKYYDLLYVDKDYESESDYVYSSLKKHKKSINTLLELGCGSGGHAKYLVNYTDKITGIDKSSQMIQEAKNKNIEKFEAIVSDITNFNLHQKYDAVIALFHVISYLDQNNDLINCFNSVNSHLNKDGLFLFDFWYTPSVLSLKPEVKIKRFSNDEMSIVRIAEPISDTSNNVVCVNFDVSIEFNKNDKIHRIKESHRMRHFSLPEIELLALHCGFTVIHKEEFLSKKEPSNFTWGVSVILKKI